MLINPPRGGSEGDKGDEGDEGDEELGRITLNCGLLTMDYGLMTNLIFLYKYM